MLILSLKTLHFTFQCKSFWQIRLISEFGCNSFFHQSVMLYEISTINAKNEFKIFSFWQQSICLIFELS